MNVKESVEMAMIEKQTEAINTSAVDTVSALVNLGTVYWKTSMML